MKKTIYIFFVLLIFSACEDRLTENVYSFYDPSTYLISAETGYSLVDGITMDWNGSKMFRKDLPYIYWGMTADHYLGRDFGHSSREPLFLYTFDADNKVIEQAYAGFYQSIYRANSVIDAVPYATYDEVIKEYQIAEAHFYRGFSYFHLVRLFGGVPILTSTDDVSRVEEISRASVSEVYDLIIEDFKFARDYLPSKSEQNAGRPFNNTASAYLAEVYATLSGPETRIGGGNNKWADCITEAKNAIAGMTQEPEFKDIFTIENQNSGELLFSFQFLNQDGKDNLSNWWINIKKNRQNKLSFSKDFLDNFETGDQRIFYTIRTSFDGNNFNPLSDVDADSCAVAKVWYDNDKQEETSDCNVIVKRLSGVKLLLAEAINESNNGPNLEAYAAINEIRSRAGLEPLSDLTYEEFKDAVRKERRIELACEYSTYMDLKRWGVLIETINTARKQDSQYPDFKEVDDYRVLLPIPQSEINRNKAINQEDQNTGY
ncbi:RagB/SusD family nutrient uptake outer membrane protein [Maribellus maritimus]|uniref:RagB/SusD family nutrient uptake outer membrane protein n=1 Tax=Maribellus maritimus TaxID=2870838 RepID=UPI001EECED9F|nr:RagB/SusD family nutrient uptake outer membrane protein [Maribellus maritimus]MCG6191012.1 RagB/SusD family nutrient uptake outer membrane protein [Maribellus maritimus]